MQWEEQFDWDLQEQHAAVGSADCLGQLRLANWVSEGLLELVFLQDELSEGTGVSELLPLGPEKSQQSVDS